jgi:hypothetical protein
MLTLFEEPPQLWDDALPFEVRELPMTWRRSMCCYPITSCCGWS